MKVKEVKNVDSSHHSWAVKCPGCGDHHLFDDRWSFNGNIEKPTFSPSMNATRNWQEWHPELGKQNDVCHSFVTDGMIRFLSDCTHPFANQTLPLPDIDPLWNERR